MDSHNAASDPSKEWTPEQKKRLALAIGRVEGVVDGLGHRLDKGIVQAVAMLNELGINTSASCEGHVDWATGGPYIDITAKEHTEIKARLRAVKPGPAQEEEQERLRAEMKLANTLEAKKILPALNEFYKARDTSYERRIGLSFYGQGITRLESVGVAFLSAESDPAAKVERLKEFQSEMRDFSDFLVAYEPVAAPFLRNLGDKLGGKHERPIDSPRAGAQP